MKRKQRQALSSELRLRGGFLRAFVLSLIFLPLFAAQALNPSSTAIVPYLRCIKALEKAGANAHTTQVMLAQQLSGLPNSRPSWIEKNITPALKRSITQIMNLKHYLEDGLKPGESVYWLQQGSVKELNEKLLNMGGTEYYLRKLDEELGLILKKDPTLGRMIHDNYKDRVIASSLSQADFRKRVLEPLIAKVSRDVADMHSTHAADTESAWAQWIHDTTTLGRGTDLVTAHLNKMGFDKPEAFTQQIAVLNSYQKRLSVALKRANMDLPNLFSIMKANDNDVEKVTHALMGQKLDTLAASRLASLGVNYRKALDIADFLPLDTIPSSKTLDFARGALAKLESGLGLNKNDLSQLAPFIKSSWTAQQADFLSKTVSSGGIVAMDVKGLGLKGLMARNDWLLRGAKPNELPHLYDQITHDLVARVDELSAGVRRLSGDNPNIHIYRTGDDVLLSLPKISKRGPPDITVEQYEAIMQYLADQKDIYSYGSKISKPGNTESIAKAIADARNGLFDGKAELKKPAN